VATFRLRPTQPMAGLLCRRASRPVAGILQHDAQLVGMMMGQLGDRHKGEHLGSQALADRCPGIIPDGRRVAVGLSRFGPLGANPDWLDASMNTAGPHPIPTLCRYVDWHTR